MDSSAYSRIKTSRGMSYSYLHLPPKEIHGNYILFLHGFPSSSHDWHYQIKYFAQRGYGILAPDLLGYGDTSKPLDMKEYRGKLMCEDVKDILEHEKVQKVIGVAHDWGSFLLSRLGNYFPSLFSKFVFIDVGYTAPGRGITREIVNNVNSAVEAALGYQVLGYFLFFEEKDAASLMDQNSESAHSLFFSKDADLGRKYMGAVGGFRKWVTEGKIAPTEAFVSTEDKAAYDQAFKNGGYGPALNWYIAPLNNVNGADDEDIPPENHTLQQPTLLFTSGNFISASADFPSQMKPFMPNLTVNHMSNCGHWIHLEEPQVVNEALNAFFEG